MKKLLTILHAENRLSPSVLKFVKGGEMSMYSSCMKNNCNLFDATCTVNSCQINDLDCISNSCYRHCKVACYSNCDPNVICREDLNPDPNCPKAIYQ